MPVNKKLAKRMATRLQGNRASCDMSQGELSRVSGVSRTVINQIEKCRGIDARLTTLLRLTKALGIGIDDLVAE